MTSKELKKIMDSRKWTVEKLSKITGYSVGNIQHALKSGNITKTMECGIVNAELVEIFIVAMADKERKQAKVLALMKWSFYLLLIATLILAFFK